MRTDLIGYIAAIMTTAAFAPQVFLTWKTRNVEGISLGMYSIFTTGVFLWLLYGIQIGAVPVIAANSVTLLFAGMILVMKVRFGGK
jgi:MtN3 and saliva related transmembrane protein